MAQVITLSRYWGDPPPSTHISIVVSHYETYRQFGGGTSYRFPKTPRGEGRYDATETRAAAEQLENESDNTIKCVVTMTPIRNLIRRNVQSLAWLLIVLIQERSVSG